MTGNHSPRGEICESDFNITWNNYYKKILDNHYDNLISVLENKLDLIADKFDRLIEAFSRGTTVAMAPQSVNIQTDADSPHLFGNWLQTWYETYKKPKLKDSTLYSMDISIKHLLNSPIANTHILKLDGVEIQNYLMTIQQGNTRKKVKQVIKTCLDKALKLHKIPYNPVEAVELPAHKAQHYRPLEFDEQNKIIQYYENQKQYGNYNVDAKKYLAMFEFLCCTGLRIGECLALDYDKDVDYKTGLINVNKTLNNRTGAVGTPKSFASGRKVPFLPSLSPAIKTLKKYDFSYTGVRQHFVRVYKALKIKGTAIHTFRHTFVSMCYACKMSDKRIQSIVGHSEINTTLNIYTHLLEKGASPIYDYIKLLKDNLE